MGGKVYLSGPIRGLSYNRANNWRTYGKKWLNKYELVALNPMRHKESLRGETFLKDIPGSALISSRALITRDRFDVMNCDCLLVNLLGADKISIGTIGEIFWADVFRKPVILVIEKKGNIHDNIFLREIAGFTADTLE